MLTKISKLLSTLGGLGYLWAPGTWASLITLFIGYQFLAALPVEQRLIIFFVALVILFFATEQFRRKYNFVDPPFIVADEIAGCLLMVTLLPANWLLYSLAFVLFRFFDITKILGVDKIQSLPKTVGIMADDLLAACYTLLILFIVAQLL